MRGEGRDKGTDGNRGADAFHEASSRLVRASLVRPATFRIASTSSWRPLPPPLPPPPLPRCSCALTISKKKAGIVLCHPANWLSVSLTNINLKKKLKGCKDVNKVVIKSFKNN